MKHVLSLMLTLAMVFVLAVPCFAAEGEEKPRKANTNSVRYAWDRTGNCYRVTGSIIINSRQGTAYTAYAVSIYAEGLPTSTQYVTHIAETTTYVSFMNGTSDNDHTLNSYVQNYGGTEGTAYECYTFTAAINSIQGNHYFWTDNGASVNFGTSVLETSYY